MQERHGLRSSAGGRLVLVPSGRVRLGRGTLASMRNAAVLGARLRSEIGSTPRDKRLSKPGPGPSGREPQATRSDREQHRAASEHRAHVHAGDRQGPVTGDAQT
jgi:hypothetical protein